MRGVCVLGMLSQTFAVALGPAAQRLYLHNARFDTATGHAAALVDIVCAGIETTKARAREVAKVAASSTGLVAVLCRRGPMLRLTKKWHARLVRGVNADELHLAVFLALFQELCFDATHTGAVHHIVYKFLPLLILFR